MVCQLISNPAPKFYWQFPEDTNITSTPSRQIVDQDLTSTVRFTALAQQDYGEYYCHAYNEVGRNYFKLQMQEPGEIELGIHHWAHDVVATLNQRHLR